MIQEGEKIPELKLPDQDGKERTLTDLAGPAGLVLYVYPKDNTPGCTTEAQDFRDRVGDFEELGFHIAGVSRDSAASHCGFIAKHELNFPLLTDADGEYLEKIGAFGDKKMYGKVTRGIIRSTFVINRKGEVLKAYGNVRAKGHAERVYGDLQDAD